MAARSKISREGQVDDFELELAQQIQDLEQNSDLKTELRGLQFVSAKQVFFRAFPDHFLHFSD